MRIFLNAETHLPTAVEWSSAYPADTFWSIWGDVTTRIYYSFWWLQNGIHYPLQADIVRNGLPDRTITITKLEFNPSVPTDEFAISAETRAAFAPRAQRTADDRSPGEKTVELAPGIVLIPGAWNTTLVRQDDGVVVLEAPISSGYSAKVMAVAQSKFPGMPIKAVISTSDSWPHIGGDPRVCCPRDSGVRPGPNRSLDPALGKSAKNTLSGYPPEVAASRRPACGFRKNDLRQWSEPYGTVSDSWRDQ